MESTFPLRAGASCARSIAEARRVDDTALCHQRIAESMVKLATWLGAGHALKVKSHGSTPHLRGNHLH